MVICAPADGWRRLISHLVDRAVNHRRAHRLLPADRELVIWRPSPGRWPHFPRLRQRLLAGALYVQLPHNSPIDSIRRQEEFVPADHPRVGSGGGLHQIGTRHGRAVLLRLGSIETSGDPGRHYEALQAIIRPVVPAALATGTRDMVRWTLEEFVGGRRVDTLTEAMIEQVSGFLCDLPRTTEPITAIESSASVLASVTTAADIKGVATIIDEATRSLPAVVAHGDLWSGNLLFHRGKLTGIVDWDSWLERAVPGTDLLHLRAEEIRRSGGMTYGDLVAEGFWARPDVAGLIGTYMHRFGIPWDGRLLPIIGWAWWLTSTAGALTRSPALAGDDEWMSKNVIDPGRLITRQLR